MSLTTKERNMLTLLNELFKIKYFATRHFKKLFYKDKSEQAATNKLRQMLKDGLLLKHHAKNRLKGESDHFLISKKGLKALSKKQVELDWPNDFGHRDLILDCYSDLYHYIPNGSKLYIEPNISLGDYKLIPDLELKWTKNQRLIHLYFELDFKHSINISLEKKLFKYKHLLLSEENLDKENHVMIFMTGQKENYNFLLSHIKDTANPYIFLYHHSSLQMDFPKLNEINILSSPNFYNHKLGEHCSLFS